MFRAVDPPQKRRRLMYDRANLQRAFEATLGGMSAYRAAKVYSVPPTTLQNRISGRVASDARVGHETIFTSSEEAKLYNNVTYMAEIGFGYNKTSIQYMAKDYADSLNKQSKGEKLSDNWFYGFIKRWPDLKIVKPQKLSIARARSASRETLDSYYKELEVVLSTNNIKNRPWKIFNIDETGVNTEHSPPKIVCKKDTAPQNITLSRSATVTVIAAGNVAGQSIPPYYVFPGKRWSDEFLKGSCPGSAGEMSKTAIEEILYNATSATVTVYNQGYDYLSSFLDAVLSVNGYTEGVPHDHVVLTGLLMIVTISVTLIAGIIIWKVKSRFDQKYCGWHEDHLLSLCDLAKTAFTEGQIERVTYIVDKHNVDINCQLASNGLSVFLSSCLTGNKRLINYMLSKGGNIKSRTNAGDTSLYLATYAVINHGHSDHTVLEDLMLAGCDVNQANNHGYVPLHRAAGGGRIEIIKLLMNYGASPYKCSIDGIYPVDIAVNNGHLEAARLLQIRVYNPYVWDVIEPHTPPHIKLGLQSPKKHHLIESSCQISSPALKTIC